MGICAELFYSNDKNKTATLFNRVSLNSTQKTQVKKEKDELLIHIKPYLVKELGCEVRHWIQGSYKNHTLIRPVHKGMRFDIDIGLYLICNAESKNITASTVRDTLNTGLSSYAQKNNCSLSDPKSACERIVFELFHIDLPIYYFDEDNDVCKLADINDGWIKSDPKEYQDWFDNEIKKHDQDCVRRIIKYLKTWASLKWAKKEECPPSIALTTLVLKNYKKCDGDDSTFSSIACSLKLYFDIHKTVPHPITGDDLLNFDNEQLNYLKSQLAELEKICKSAVNEANLFSAVFSWSICFEHCFPPLGEISVKSSNASANLPAVTTPIKIIAELWSKKENRLVNTYSDDFTAYYGDKIKFYVGNQAKYPYDSKIIWMVRNQGEEAENIHDLGHINALDLREQQEEKCEYDGAHYMECYVMKNSTVLGVGTIKVTIKRIRRPQRNPPKPAYTKIKRR